MIGLGLSLSLGAGQRRGGGAPYTFTNAEAAAYAARLSTQPDDSRKALIDTLVGGIKAAGAWTRLDVLHIYAGLSAADSVLNWKDATRTASVTGGRFFPDRGWYLNGTSDFINTGFTPSAGVNYTKDDACIGLWVRNRDQRSGATGSAGSATIATLVNPRNVSNKVATRVNSTTSNTSTASNTDGFGLVVGNRTGASAEDIYVRGTLFHSGTTTTSAPAAIPMLIGKSNTAFIEQQAVAFFAGASMDATMQAAVSAALSQYLTAIGVTSVGTGSSAGEATTVPLIARKVLPDGANPQLAGRGLPGCGWDSTLADSTAGERWVSWSLGSASAYGGIVRVTAPASDAGVTLIGEYPLVVMGAAAGITVPTTSGVQGVWVDKSDQSIWFVAVDINGGGVPYLCHAAAPVGLAAPVLLSCKAFPNNNLNGMAKDKRGDWWFADKTNGRIYKGAVAGDGTPTVTSLFLIMGGNADQVNYVESRDCLLFTLGANGADGFVYQVPLIGDYGAPYVRTRFQMTDWQGVEGVYWNGVNFEGPNDMYTHTEASFPYNNLSISGPVALPMA